MNLDKIIKVIELLVEFNDVKLNRPEFIKMISQFDVKIIRDLLNNLDDSSKGFVHLSQENTLIQTYYFESVFDEDYNYLISNLKDENLIKFYNILNNYHDDIVATYLGKRPKLMIILSKIDKFKIFNNEQ